MTDLLNTQSDTAADAVDLEPRIFRAATIDDAVAAARTAFGQEVELRQANRVRRGGLGGFFATDLGVEILAAPSAAASERRQPSPDGVEFPGPTTPRMDEGSLSVIERLISEAQAADRPGAGISPHDHRVDHFPPVSSPHPFAHAIESELAAAELVTDTVPTLLGASRVDLFDVLPDETAPPEPRGASVLFDGWADDDFVVEPEPVRATEPEVRLPDVPLAAAMKSVIEEEKQAATPRPLMPILSRPPAVPGGAVPLPPPVPMAGTSALDTDQILASILSLGDRCDGSVRRITLNVTTGDGSTMSVAADFEGDDHD